MTTWLVTSARRTGSKDRFDHALAYAISDGLIVKQADGTLSAT